MDGFSLFFLHVKLTAVVATACTAACLPRAPCLACAVDAFHFGKGKENDGSGEEAADSEPSSSRRTVKKGKGHVGEYCHKHCNPYNNAVLQAAPRTNQSVCEQGFRKLGRYRFSFR